MKCRKYLVIKFLLEKWGEDSEYKPNVWCFQEPSLLNCMQYLKIIIDYALRFSLLYIVLNTAVIQ